MKGYVPDNTAHYNKWAIKNFESWLRSHHDTTEESAFPENILLMDDVQLFCSALCTYVMETRKENGKPILPRQFSTSFRAFSDICGRTSRMLSTFWTMPSTCTQSIILNPLGLSLHGIMLNPLAITHSREC